MDRSQAKRQLSMLALKCDSCGNVFQSYRMLIGKQKRGTQPEEISPETKIDVQPQSKPAQTASEPISQPNPSPSSHSSLFPLHCLSCFTSPKSTLKQPDVHPETYYQTGTRYMKQIPLPEYSIAEECLKLMGQIQEETQSILKGIMEALDNFKFYMLRLNADVQKMCKNYVEKVKYFETLRIQEMLWLEMGQKQPSQTRKEYDKIKNMFDLNQSQSILQLTRKYHQLNTLKSKLPELKLSTPTLPTSTPSQKRKRTPLTNIPISSMIDFNGQQYFGTADGRILYNSLSSLISHQGHESLIRSFSHNDQYSLYSGSDDFSIKCWDTRGGKLECLKVFGVVGEGKSYHRNIAVIEDGRLMVSTRGQFDGFRLRVWKLEEEFENVGVLEGHQSFIRTMAIIDREKNIIITGSDDKTIKIWHPSQSKPLRTIPRTKRPQNIIVNLQLSLLCIIEQQNRVSILDLTDYSPITSMTTPRKILCSCGFIPSPSLSPQPSHLLLCMPTLLALYSWTCQKIWSLDLELSYTPVNVMQVGDGFMLSDGGGVIDEILVGDVWGLEREVIGELGLAGVQ